MIFMQQIIAQVVSDDVSTKYVLNEQREKIIIQTNQQLYGRGDSIWIRCHLVDAETQIPSTSPDYPEHRSKYIYVELHDCQSDTLMQRYKIKADSLGVFANAIALPHDIKEGYYMLVAYTRWMMNFEDSDFGYKEIYVMGDNNIIEKTSLQDRDLIVQVYPEGGVLIPQCIQNVVYTITDSQHNPQDAELRLVNIETDSILAYSHTEYNGLGQLSFIPEEGQHYYLEAYTKNGEYGRQDICKLKEKGATLQVRRRKSLVSVNILSHNYDTEKLQLLLYNKGFLSSINTSDNPIILSCDAFRKGKVTFVLIDSSDSSILSMRSIFVK